MYFFYGPYNHDAGSVSLATNRRAVMNSRGRVTSHIHTWNLTGEVKGASQTAVDTAMAALEYAYGVHNLDAGFRLDSGAISTHVLASNLSISGTKVTQFSWVSGLGNAEYATGRSFQIQLQAEYLVGTFGENLLFYNETVSYRGDGGPQYIVIPTDNSDTVVQQASQASPMFLEQRGVAVGLNGYPLHNDPLPVGLPDAQASSLDRTFSGTSPAEYTVAWFYRRLLGSNPAAQYPYIR